MSKKELDQLERLGALVAKGRATRSDELRLLALERKAEKRGVK